MSRLTTCCACHTEHTTTPTADGWSLTPLANRGNRAAYTCPSCATACASYTADNNAADRGTSTASGLTFGFEFECNAPSPTFRAQMQHYGFLPSEDCTVDLEFKSPVYRSLNPVKGFLRTIESLIEDGHAAVGSNCGTHLHVGHELINADNRRALASFYGRLFAPLSDAMENDPLGCRLLFGRELNGWADAIDPSEPYRHANFINIEHAHTIEYRICKFMSATQYLRAAKCCKEFTACIVTNYLTHYENGVRGAKLAHKADVTAKKLVKIYKKYAADALMN